MEKANSLLGVFAVSIDESTRRFLVSFGESFAFRPGMSRVAVAFVGYQTVCDIAALSLLTIMLYSCQLRHASEAPVIQV